MTEGDVPQSAKHTVQPIDDDGRDFTVEQVCFIPNESHPTTGLGRLATCIADGGCTIEWHEHLLRITLLTGRPTDSEAHDG